MFYICAVLSHYKGVGGVSNTIWIFFSSKKTCARLWKVFQVHIIGEITSASGFNHSSLFCKYQKLIFKKEREHWLHFNLLTFENNAELLFTSHWHSWCPTKVGNSHWGSLEASLWIARRANAGGHMFVSPCGCASIFISISLYFPLCLFSTAGVLVVITVKGVFTLSTP